MSAQLVYQGAVNRWECDQGGHLNVRFQLERAFTGLARLAAALEMPRAFAQSAAATLIPLDMHMRFLKEARAGEALVMHGGVLNMDETDARMLFDMRHRDGAAAAAFTMQARHAHPRELRGFAWSARSRAAAKGLSVKAPEHAKPRSIDLARAPGDASLTRAKALGATQIGACMARPDQCDAFGRLRAEFAFGFVSDSVPNLLHDWRAKLGEAAGAEIAGAVVEARVVFRQWPLAGELIEVWSAIVEIGERVERLVHWLIDPVSGEAWMSLEVAALSFDIATRKAIAHPAELRQAFAKQIVAGMGI